MGRKFPVLYLFKVNSDYAGSREGARIALNENLFRKSSYFSKVELVFNQRSTPPSKEQAVTASQKLLSIILPIFGIRSIGPTGSFDEQDSVSCARLAESVCEITG